MNLNALEVVLLTISLAVVSVHSIPDREQLTAEVKEPKIENIDYEEINVNNNENNFFAVKTIDSEPPTKVSYSGSQLWKIKIDDNYEKKKVVARLRDEKDISMWGGNLTFLDILVRNHSLTSVRRELDVNEISFDIIIEDVQKAIDEENPPITDDDELEIRQAKRVPLKYKLAWRGLTSLGNRLEMWPYANWGHRMTWQAYHKLEDIHGYLDYLAETYPNLCSVYSIGKSVRGKDLKVLKISNGKFGNKAVWVDGGIHAREWISPASVTYIINTLVLNYEREPASIQNIDWYFLPVANPDGYTYSHTTDRLWRKNRARNGICYGTDLNRNYGYRWGGKGNGKNPCQEIYGGSAPFSEPETAAIKKFITGNNANWKASISFHSYGQYILYPWGYDKVVPPDYKDLQLVAQQAAAAINAASGAFYKIGPAANTLYPAAGGSDDWAKGAVGMKYAYTIELRDQGRHGFVLPAGLIEPTALEALAALRVIGQAASLA